MLSLMRLLMYPLSSTFRREVSACAALRVCWTHAWSGLPVRASGHLAAVAESTSIGSGPPRLMHTNTRLTVR